MSHESPITVAEVSQWHEEDLKALLIKATEANASDVLLYPGRPVWIRVHGKWYGVSRRPLSPHEVASLVEKTSSNDSASTIIGKGDDYDYSYEILIERGIRRRFRCNATACRANASMGIALTLRSIPSLPPTMDDLGVPDEIRRHITPDNGLVLVTGVMGSGKSTLLAAVLRFINEHFPKHILSYESPIEFDLMGVPSPKGPVEQTEIPRHLSEFKMATRNSTRRAADVILFGESRDVETLEGMIEAADIGVCVYSTVHTRDVASTMQRIINVFPQASRDQMFATMANAMRLVVHQRLLPCKAGGRVAIQEYLVFSPEIRERIAEQPIPRLASEVQKAVEAFGRPLYLDAREKYEAGMIYESDFKQIERETQHKRS